MKVSLAPPPCLFNTTPSNTCILSLFPSIILTCTLTVSPGPKLGTSFLIVLAQLLLAFHSSFFLLDIIDVLNYPTSVNRGTPVFSTFYIILYFNSYYKHFYVFNSIYRYFIVYIYINFSLYFYFSLDFYTNQIVFLWLSL